MTKIFGKPSSEGLPYSKSVKAGDSIYLSGLTACDDTGKIVADDVGEQTNDIMRQAATELSYYDATLADVVKVVVSLPDPENFDAFNAAYAPHFPKNPPARTTLCAPIPSDGKVEIDLIAYLPAAAGV